MSKQKKLIATVVVVAILLMGIGYALLNATELTIGGTATATADQENFKVYYTGTVTPADDENVEVDVENGNTHADVTITGLSAKGDSKHAILEIINDSNGIVAESVVVKAESVGDSNDYITIDVEMCDEAGTPTTVTDLAVEDTTYVKVTATLEATPTEEDVTVDITATLEATPKAN